jgi:intracellular multiplication protein IcmP
MPDGQLDRDAAEDALAEQLGARWKGPFALPPHQQVLLAAFCLKTVRQRDDAEEMLGRLACCWDHKGGLKLGRERGLLSSARRILRNKKIAEKTLSNCNRHAYVTTALMRALDTAREEGGVLAPAQFVWLRAHDRALWYPLNNLGRTAFHMEALGACSHYRAEKQVNRPIIKPRVGDGIVGLLEHLGNPLFARPIPAVDYSASKKKKPGKSAGIMKPKAA